MLTCHIIRATQVQRWLDPTQNKPLSAQSDFLPQIHEFQVLKEGLLPVLQLKKDRKKKGERASKKEKKEIKKNKQNTPLPRMLKPDSHPRLFCVLASLS